MKFTSIAIAAASFLLFNASSLAADQAPPVTDWSIETVVVTAQAPGPAIWHLSKGDSEIWILGTLGPIPEGFTWNHARLETLIDGAKEVLMPPEASANFFDMSWFLLTNWGILSMPDGQKMEDSLPPDLRARFVAARQSLGKDASRYEDNKPLIAAFRLRGDFMEAKKLLAGGQTYWVGKIAGSKHVKTRPIGKYDVSSMVKALLKLKPEAGQTCLAAALRDIDNVSSHGVAAAQAWAVGDLAGIKAHYSPSALLDCVLQSASFSKLNQQAVDDSLKAVHAALSTPGKTVMLVDVGTLLRGEGVVEKLKAEGITVEGPAENTNSP